jgi:hypothetical protein
MRKTYKILAEDPKGRDSCGRPRHRWADNTKMDLKERESEGVALPGAGYGPAAVSCEPRIQPLSYKT